VFTLLDKIVLFLKKIDEKNHKITELITNKKERETVNYFKKRDILIISFEKKNKQ
jgi:hypothetical protein